MYVCLCHSVTDRDIHQAVVNGADTLRELSNQLKVATCCGRCASCARDVLQEAQAMCAKPCNKQSCVKEMQLS